MNERVRYSYSVPKFCEIERACSKEERRGLNHVRLEPEAGLLVATDTRMLAVVPVAVEPADGVELESEPPLHVESSAHKRFRMGTPKGEESNTASVNGTVRAPAQGNGWTEERPADERDVRFPEQWRSILPGDKPTLTVKVNVEYLWRAWQALGEHREKDAPSVTLELYTDTDGKVTRPIVIRGRNERFAVVMPINF